MQTPQFVAKTNVCTCKQPHSPLITLHQLFYCANNCYLAQFNSPLLTATSNDMPTPNAAAAFNTLGVKVPCHSYRH
jgi:hypothetical protein